MSRYYLSMRCLFHIFFKIIHRIVSILPFCLMILVNPDAEAEISDFKIEILSLEQGLSQSTIHCVYQDSKNLLWLGTNEGLNKYNGHSFKIYRKNNPSNGISNNKVRSIYEDKSGNLWIGTNGGGLNCYNRQTDCFINYHSSERSPASLNRKSIWSLCVDQRDYLWLAANAGLSRMDISTGEFHMYSLESPNETSGDSNIVAEVYCTSEGELLAATHGGIYKYVPRDDSFVIYPDIPENLNKGIRCLHEEKGKGLWAGTLYGLIYLDYESAKVRYYQSDPQDVHSLSSSRIFAIESDGDGAIWIGTDDGLNLFNAEDDNFDRFHLRYEALLSSNQITSLHWDSSGILWVGTNSGLNKIYKQSKKFNHNLAPMNVLRNISNNVVRTFAEEADGTLWIGTQKGLNKYDPRTGKIEIYKNDIANPKSISSDYIRSILIDSDGDIWIGTHDKGINLYDKKKEGFVRLKMGSESENVFNINSVRYLYEDSHKNVWICTWGGGLVRYNKKANRYKIFDYSNAHSKLKFVQSVFEDTQGRIWVLGFHGLLLFDEKMNFIEFYIHNPEKEDGVSSDRMLCMHEDKYGTLWIGTNGGGLNRYNKESNTFHIFSEDDGLANNVVYGILEDSEGHLWLSTNFGISKFSPRTEIFKNYNPGDGLQSYEFNIGAYYKGPSGRFYFGGINGFNAFLPEEIREAPNESPLLITELTQARKAFSSLAMAPEFVNKIFLKWPDNYFEFEFALLHYLNPSNHQFAYKLKGFDKYWNYTGNRNFGLYTNLPGGHYTLQIKGANHDEIWNEKGFSVDVIVEPPPWFSLTAMISYIIAVLALHAWFLCRKHKSNMNSQSGILFDRFNKKTESRFEKIEDEGDRNKQQEMSYQALESRVIQAIKEDISISSPDKGFEAKFNEFGITTRERDIIKLTIKGITNQKIAESLSISTGTVGRHLENIYKKCCINNRTELTNIFK